MSKHVTLGIVITISVVVVFGFFFFRPVMSLFTFSSVSEPTPAPHIQAVESSEPPSITDTQTSSPTDATGSVLASDELGAANEVLVTYTTSGFKPRTIEITQGQTVTFINMSEGKMWVGANDHPTHTKYPVKSDSDCLGSSFDSCMGLPVGESWSFTFTEVGSWDYHNHAQAAHRGTVVVK